MHHKLLNGVTVTEEELPDAQKEAEAPGEATGESGRPHPAKCGQSRTPGLMVITLLCCVHRHRGQGGQERRPTGSPSHATTQPERGRQVLLPIGREVGHTHLYIPLLLLDGSWLHLYPVTLCYPFYAQLYNKCV